MQEVYEIITPSRKIVQEIQPVQEEILTIVSKSDGQSGGGAGELTKSIPLRTSEFRTAKLEPARIVAIGGFEGKKLDSFGGKKFDSFERKKFDLFEGKKEFDSFESKLLKTSPVIKGGVGIGLVGKVAKALEMEISERSSGGYKAKAAKA